MLNPPTIRPTPVLALLTAGLVMALAPGRAFDSKVRFSHTDVRSAAGWKDAFGQASLPLPADAPR